jgi:hypothetical protein
MSDAKTDLIDPMITLGMHAFVTPFCCSPLLQRLEVYVHRANRAYTLLPPDYEEGDGSDDGEVPRSWTISFPPPTPRIG